VYLDDIYFDNTRARVEIGNASTWNSCTRRELQVATAWSNTGVTFTVSPGVFNSGAQAYLYVVDAQGVANSQGFPITLGEGAAAPEPPQNVTVQ